MFGITIVRGVNGDLYVHTPYANHFTRSDPGGFWASRGKPRPLGSGGYCMNRRGRLLFGF